MNRETTSLTLMIFLVSIRVLEKTALSIAYFYLILPYGLSPCKNPSTVLCEADYCSFYIYIDYDYISVQYHVKV